MKARLFCSLVLIHLPSLPTPTAVFLQSACIDWEQMFYLLLCSGTNSHLLNKQRSILSSRYGLLLAVLYWGHGRMCFNSRIDEREKCSLGLFSLWVSCFLHCRYQALRSMAVTSPTLCSTKTCFWNGCHFPQLRHHFPLPDMAAAPGSSSTGSSDSASLRAR